MVTGVLTVVTMVQSYDVSYDRGCGCNYDSMLQLGLQLHFWLWLQQWLQLLWIAFTVAVVVAVALLVALPFANLLMQLQSYLVFLLAQNTVKHGSIYQSWYRL